MAKKPSCGWERAQIEEWAFSVAALRWSRDEYWKASRGEFLEAKRMWMRINGVDTSKEEAPTQEQADAMSKYLASTFGGRVETVDNG